MGFWDYGIMCDFFGKIILITGMEYRFGESGKFNISS